MNTKLAKYQVYGNMPFSYPVIHPKQKLKVREKPTALSKTQNSAELPDNYINTPILPEWQTLETESETKNLVGASDHAPTIDYASNYVYKPLTRKKCIRRKSRIPVLKTNKFMQNKKLDETASLLVSAEGYENSYASIEEATCKKPRNLNQVRQTKIPITRRDQIRKSVQARLQQLTVLAQNIEQQKQLLNNSINLDSTKTDLNVTISEDKSTQDVIEKDSDYDLVKNFDKTGNKFFGKNRESCMTLTDVERDSLVGSESGGDLYFSVSHSGIFRGQSLDKNKNYQTVRRRYTAVGNVSPYRGEAFPRLPEKRGPTKKSVHNKQIKNKAAMFSLEDYNDTKITRTDFEIYGAHFKDFCQFFRAKTLGRKPGKKSG